jgi:hypothetical protein
LSLWQVELDDIIKGGRSLSLSISQHSLATNDQGRPVALPLHAVFGSRYDDGARRLCIAAHVSSSTTLLGVAVSLDWLLISPSFPRYDVTYQHRPSSTNQPARP